MTTLSRRHFLAAAGSAVALPALAVDPVKRPAGKPKLQLGIAAYSYRQYLDLKKPSMTLFDVIDICAKLKVDAIELTMYYFAETTDAYVDRLKAACEKAKLAIACLPTKNDFVQLDEAKRKADIADVKAWTKRAQRLGTKAVRIFAGNQPKGESLEACQERCAKAIDECAKVAEDCGVTLCLENHGGITATAAGLIGVLDRVKSKAVGVNLDSSNFRVADPYGEVAKVAPYAVVSQIKTEVYGAKGPTGPLDVVQYLKVLYAANYSGPVSLEHEAKEDPKEFVPKHIAAIREAIATVYGG
jgi:sugar phosphate isomerase/epimerase